MPKLGKKSLLDVAGGKMVTIVFDANGNTLAGEDASVRSFVNATIKNPDGSIMQDSGRIAITTDPTIQSKRVSSLQELAKKV